MSLFAENSRALWIALCDFIRFAPASLGLIFFLMLAESVSAGIGLMLIFPLLQLVGLDVGGGMDAGIVDAMTILFAWVGIPLSMVYVLLSYVLVVSLVATLRYQLSVQSSRVQQAYVCHLRNNLYKHLISSEWIFIVSHKMSDFNYALTQQVQGIGLAVQLLLRLCSQLALALVMIVLVFLLSWQMSLLAMLFAAVLLLALLPVNRRIYRSGSLHLEGFKSIYQLLGEQLSSLKMIKSYGAEKHFMGQLVLTGQNIEGQVARFNKMHALSQWFLMVGAVVIFSVFFYVAKEQMNIALSTILMLLIVLSRLLPQVTGIQRTWQQLLHRVADIKNAKLLLDQCLAAQECSAFYSGQAPILNEAITLKNVSFRYPGKNNCVIENFSATIPLNHTVALTGHSGAGKSTLADLVAGLLEPQSGTICCDHTALVDEQRFAWRNSVAYVTQEVFLFHDTIRANLHWVADNVADADLWTALKLAAADFVSSLPDGLDTVIGDRGTRLSGGERQRLALARALLCHPQLLILDEATSSLDRENERTIQKALHQLHGKLTILIIAHRPTTIEHADQVIDLASLHADSNR